MKDKYYMIILIATKEIWQIHDKKKTLSQQIKCRRNVAQHNKGYT